MIDIDEIEPIEVIKGFRAKFIHTDSMTLGYWDTDKDAVLPIHKHIHEQITQVEEGEFELTIDGKTNIYKKGMVAVIPPNVPHGGRAITACKLFDIFLPVREDYKKLQEK